MRHALSRRDPRLPHSTVVRALAVRIGCDPRSIERELLTPGSVTGDAGVRIRASLARLGIGANMPPIEPVDLDLVHSRPMAIGER